MTSRKSDTVDVILQQWRRERPDIDTSPMGPIGRLKRCNMLLEPKIEAAFTPFGLTRWQFDMLATLRRSGAPFNLSPTALFSTLMITSGTMTHRLKLLEASELIERLPNADDARSMLVQLTEKGLSLINRVVEVHVINEKKLLALIPENTLAELDNALSQLMVALEENPAVNGKKT
ncbi:MarR family transcriptional regulator [Erwiniaceae bacterium BAC15a-03b]|uniref:MarR family transcriptional regulator n=1 Tax=Winslowiella arboricola TaxID=2978220 RepID=A0A9J6PNA4_9GAMM|nr:MarR family transcriptional regulator [Winslowiella arboricola]MCU5772068.1 MarR family transcriptional regulator [Winslowiella arboricola]MCU5776140.1 MarR family transcriptional regulator [Winslowiella arboricola]